MSSRRSEPYAVGFLHSLWPQIAIGFSTTRLGLILFSSVRLVLDIYFTCPIHVDLHFCVREVTRLVKRKWPKLESTMSKLHWDGEEAQELRYLIDKSVGLRDRWTRWENLRGGRTLRWQSSSLIFKSRWNGKYDLRNIYIVKRWTTLHGKRFFWLTFCFLPAFRQVKFSSYLSSVFIRLI